MIRFPSLVIAPPLHHLPPPLLLHPPHLDLPLWLRRMMTTKVSANHALSEQEMSTS